jgi:lincosamide nucleotidyltransferase A/C/D/E
MNQTTSHPQLLEAIRAAGLKNSIVCLHSSLKSFGQLKGGPQTLIDAFLESGCTLLVPTFTYNCEIAALRSLAQNAYDGEDDFSPGMPYDPEIAMIARDMGAIPAHVLQIEGRARGNHPLNSFAALGPLADELIRAQGPLDVYGPYKAAYAGSVPAYVVLAGVDLTSATPVHFAEERAGRRLFRRWARHGKFGLQEVEVGSCSNGFNNLDGALAGIETRVQAGQSEWRVFPLREFVDTLAAVIAGNPSVTHCPDANCLRCHDSVAGGPILRDETTAADVVAFVEILRKHGIEVCLDGGWGVDALLGWQSRPHADLDIALEHRHVPTVRALLEAHGYRDVPRDDTRDCNFVMGDEMGRLVDFHTYSFDENGKLTFGLDYPPESLAGSGVVAGVPVRCITPEWMVKFHSGYELDEGDYHDVRLLCEKFEIPLPQEYRRFVDEDDKGEKR